MLEEASVVSDDVVIAEVAAGLDRDQDHGQATGVFQAVRLAKGNVDGLALSDQAGAEADHNLGGAFDHDPVFRSVEVGLQRCGLTRFKGQRADAKTPTLGKDGGGGCNGLDGGEGQWRLGKTCGVRSVHDLLSFAHVLRLAAKWLARG
jgi:hypothetical protein